MSISLRHLTLLALVVGLAFALVHTASADEGPGEELAVPVAAPVTTRVAPPEPRPASPLATVERLAEEEHLLPRGSRYLLAKIAHHRKETWRWQTLMDKRRTPTSDTARRSRNPNYRRWVLRLWTRRADQARRLAANPPRKAAWLCIHQHEGSWRDPSPPYYGGLQMDLSFQRAYGADLLRRKGTADNWTPLEQMWVAERAYRSGRGFYPWPNTARYCGLL